MTELRGPALRVMLVDDHAHIRSAIRQAISAPDIVIVGEAAAGEEAIGLALSLRPDVILLDIDLPGLSGLDVVRELAPRLPKTSVVMLTVSSASRDLFEAIRLGAVGYLTKDLSPDALLRSLRGIADGDLAMPRRMAAQVLQHLAATGRAPRTGASRLDLLSPRELEVLRLLAEGLTDREIGGALAISPRTVEAHVGSILR
ncbi:MAG: response regulator transcription factor, partial [Chloroflexota bacterium]|nr:response regulator transcription factor [Chloroflexota bacterium]